MAKLGIGTGSLPNDGNGDSLVVGAAKINSNFNEIYSAIGDGTNITNTIAYANVAGIATYSSSSGISTYSSSSGIATYSSSSGISTYSSSSGIATYADTAGVVAYSIFSGISTYAEYAGISTYSEYAGISTYAEYAGISTYAEYAGISTYSEYAGISTYSEYAGISTYAEYAGISTNVIGGIATVTSLNVSGGTILQNNVTIGSNITIDNFPLSVGSIGYASTSIWINGNARVTGILDVGTSTIIINGNTNTITADNIISKKIVGISTTSFPTGDYGDLTTSSLDAFDISLIGTFDCLTSPYGFLDVVDLGIL